MLDVKAINQYYGGSHILRDVSFTAPVGECSVIPVSYTHLTLPTILLV